MLDKYKINVIYSDEKIDINDIFIKVLFDSICNDFNNDVLYNYAYLFHNEGGCWYLHKAFKRR